jgi:hypothetical protein
MRRLIALSMAISLLGLCGLRLNGADSMKTKDAANSRWGFETAIVQHDGRVLAIAHDKPDCEKVYPLPSDYQNWSNCHSSGNSACGGPDQCACLDSQRLVTFECDQGTYHQCYGEKGNGCTGN